MVATLQLTPEERTPFAYILALEIGHLNEGTAEHREVAEGLKEVLRILESAPEGPVELEFMNDELYMIGVRNHADASELEEYWLDNRASMRQRSEPAPFPDPHVGEAITRYYPQVVSDPESWHFNQVRPIFSALGFKIDRAITEAAPRVRGIYNKERAEIIRRTREMQAQRAAERGRSYPGDIDIVAWRRAIRAGRLAPGEMTDVELGGSRILIANVDGQYYALDDVCTHAPELSRLQGLAKGELDTERLCVTCPWHGAQYNVRSGRVVRQPYAPEFNRRHLVKGRLTSLVDIRRTATDIRAYPTKVEDGYD